jgi:hypothetical protein
VLWIAVSAKSYKQTEIAEYQVVNDPQRPLDTLGPATQNREFVEICMKIKKAVARGMAGVMRYA